MKTICVAAFAAHPDDAELSASGTLLAMKAQGHKTAIVNLTRGELGTRGTPEIREKEASDAEQILGVDYRLNVGLPDGGILNVPEQRLKVIAAIRALRPDIILCNAVTDRHPDHGNAATLVRESAFLAGLKNIETFDVEGNSQLAFRPRMVLHYIQDSFLKPDLVVDITPFIEQRMDSVKAFKSQFHDPKSKEPATYISSPEFYEGMYARCREMGRFINVQYGEGFCTNRPLGVNNLANLL
jgi:bacillithiol biosynthesis deacetylase BshB1